MLKLCLAFMMQNDAHWLHLHLPVYLASGVFDGMVALDGGSSDDSASYVRSLGGSVCRRVFDWNFAKQGNILIKRCEQRGYDAIYRADPDELVSIEDLRRLRTVLEHSAPDKQIALARRHFIRDRRHVHPDWYPDYQFRAWFLNQGVYYPKDQQVHECPSYASRDQQVYLADATIFHYGYLIPDSERAWRIAVYDALQKGLPMPSRADYQGHTLTIPSIPYTGTQPLDPDLVGDRAPFESVLR